VEGFHFDQRKNVVQYDNVMNRHRKATYIMRREILEAIDVSKRIQIFIEEEVAALAAASLVTQADFEDILREIFPFDEKTIDRLLDSPADKFKDVLLTETKELYAARELAFTPEVMRKVERDVYLQVLDNLWMQHLENMDHLRNGIHWMSVGQRDPLVEYRRQGQVIFEEMQSVLRHDIVKVLLHAEPSDVTDLDRPIETDLTIAARQSINNASQIVDNQDEFEEADFKPSAAAGGSTTLSSINVTSSSNDAKKRDASRKKAHKAERQRKAKARKRK